MDSIIVRLSSEDLAGQDPSGIVHPQPVILDSGLRFPTTAKLLLPTSPTRPWIFTRREHDTEKRKQLEALGAKVFAIDQDAEGRHRCSFTTGSLDRKLYRQPNHPSSNVIRSFGYPTSLESTKGEVYSVVDGRRWSQRHLNFHGQWACRPRPNHNRPRLCWPRWCQRSAKCGGNFLTGCAYSLSVHIFPPVILTSSIRSFLPSHYDAGRAIV